MLSFLGLAKNCSQVIQRYLVGADEVRTTEKNENVNHGSEFREGSGFPRATGPNNIDVDVGPYLNRAHIDPPISDLIDAEFQDKLVSTETDFRRLLVAGDMSSASTARIVEQSITPTLSGAKRRTSESKQLYERDNSEENPRKRERAGGLERAPASFQPAPSAATFDCVCCCTSCPLGDIFTPDDCACDAGNCFCMACMRTWVLSKIDDQVRAHGTARAQHHKA